MTLVEISGPVVAGVRADVASVRDVVDVDWARVRARAWGLGVPTGGFDQVLGVGDRLSTHVLPVIDVHLDRARALEALRYGGVMGACVPVLDTDPAPVAVPFTMTGLDDGVTELSWAPSSTTAIQADAREAAQSRGIGDWFSDRWDEVSGAVTAGADWVGGVAGQVWDTVVEAGAAIGDWWEKTTASLGEWIDTNLAGCASSSAVTSRCSGSWPPHYGSSAGSWWPSARS